MKRHNLAVLGLVFLLAIFGCENETPNGQLIVSVTYPEAVVVPNQPTYFIQVPGVGAEVRLYDKNAICLGYKDAMLNLVKIGDEYATSKFLQVANEKGDAVFEDIPAGEYFLIVYARQITKYSEKYIEVKSGDTLMLAKDFTDDGAYYKDLEPWDHTVPQN